MTDKSAKDKDFALNETKSLVKRAHRISNTTFIVIDESIVKRLLIDDDTWFDEKASDDRIVLRIRKGLHDVGVGES